MSLTETAKRKMGRKKERIIPKKPGNKRDSKREGHSTQKTPYS